MAEYWLPTIAGLCRQSLVNLSTQDPMTPEKAFALVEKHIEPGMVADASTLRETAFGFYFHVTSE
ncbi:MAG: hypothetical protein AAGD25_35035 [Cyanobacteria bacterium P01_F01_bin.150]